MPRKQAVSGAPLEYILHRADESESRDSKRNEHWDRVEQMRHREHEVPIPERFAAFGIRPVKVALVNELLRIVISSIAQSFASVSIPPTKLSKEAQANSTTREKWLMAVLSQLDPGEGMHRAYVDCIDHAATFGMACPKFLYLPDAWDNEQFKQRRWKNDSGDWVDEEPNDYNDRTDNYRRTAPLPFVWLTPDPRTVHLWFDNRELVEVLEISERPRYDLAEKYAEAGVQVGDDGRLFNPQYEYLGEPRPDSALGNPSADAVRFIEHWQLRKVPRKGGGFTRRAIVTYLADDAILQRIDTGYNRLPYFPFMGLSTSSRTPQYEAMGVADDVLDYVETVDRILTMWITWGTLAAYPMGLYELPPGSPSMVDEENNPITYLEWEPGTFKVAPAGSKLGWVSAPTIGADIQKLSELILKLTDRAGAIPDVMRGESKSGTPAWGLAQLLQTARRVFDPISTNFSIALSQACAFLQWLVENRVKGPVYALSEETADDGRTAQSYLPLKPSDVKGYYSCSVDIVTLTEDRRIQEGQFGIQLYQTGAIPMRELLETYLHYPAPEELMNERLVEDYRNSQQYKQMLYNRLAERIGMPEAKQMGAPPEQVAAMAPQQVPPVGAPPGAMPPGGTNQQAMIQAMLRGGASPAGMQVPAGMPASTAGAPGASLPPGGPPLPRPNAPAFVPPQAPILGAPSPRVPVPGLGLPTLNPTLRAIQGMPQPPGPPAPPRGPR